MATRGHGDRGTRRPARCASVLDLQMPTPWVAMVVALRKSAPTLADE